MQASITPAGRTRAAEVRSKRYDRSGRQWACRSALVAWLHDRDASESPTRATGWDGFFVEGRATFFGDPFSVDEGDRAAALLHRHALIDGETSGQTDGPVLSYLTDGGVRCAERFDLDVRTYLEAMEQPQAGPTFNVNATNVQLATGDRLQQTMTVTQTSAQLVLVIEGIVQMLQAFGVAAGRESELADIQAAAVADVISDRPDARAYVGSTTGWCPA